VSKYLVFINSGWLFQNVRSFLSDTYGCSVAQWATDLTELQSLLITNSGIRAIISDVPPGTTLEQCYDALEQLTHGNVKIIFIVNLDRGARIHKSKREFTVIPEQNFRAPLKSALHAC
jgi:hypothetical protein